MRTCSRREPRWRHSRHLERGWVGALFAVVLVAVVTAGCGQILGVDEYSIDPTNGASQCDALHAPDMTGHGCTTAVGVTACATGFVSENGGCRDGLSKTECPDGTVAAPGQGCRHINICVSSYYTGHFAGSLPDGGTGHGFAPSQTLYVNGASHTFGDGTSMQAPFQTIGEAITAAGQRAMLILVAPGTYREALDIKAPLAFNGSGAGPAGPDCAPVVIQAPDSNSPAVKVSTSAASGTYLAALQITGGSPGLLIDGAESVQLNGDWIHDTSGPGIIIQDDLDPASASTAGNATLVERAVGAGVEVYGSKFDAIDTDLNVLVVRDTLPLSDGREGYGIALHPDATNPAGSAPDKAKQSDLTLNGAVLEGNAGAGLFVEGSSATVTNTVIRNTHANGLGEGRGVVVQRRPLGPVSASLTLTGSIVEQSHDVGVLVIDSPAPLDGSPGVTATITNTTISDVGDDATDGGGASACTGTGLRVRSDGFRTANGPPIVLQTSLIIGARQEGIHVLGARVDVLQSIVRGTTGCGGSLGDGIAAYADQSIATKVNVTQARIEASARAGIAAFGARMNVTSSIVDGCGTVPIAKVTRGGVDASVQVMQGGCGCKSVNAACNAESPTTTPAPSLIGGNGCDAFPDGVCVTTCWDDSVTRITAGPTGPAGVPIGQVEGLVVWAPDNLNIAPALADPATSPTGGCIHWGGLPPGKSFVFALGRDRDSRDSKSIGYMPGIWRESTGSHSGNFGLLSALDNVGGWGEFTGDAQKAGTPLDARTAPTAFVLVVDQSAQANIAKGEDEFFFHGVNGVQLELVSGISSQPIYGSPSGLPDAMLHAMTIGGYSTFFNVAPGEPVIRLVPPAGSAIHCTSPWDATASTGWTINKVIAPDMLQLLTRPGFNSTVYALCSLE